MLKISRQDVSTLLPLLFQRMVVRDIKRTNATAATTTAIKTTKAITVITAITAIAGAATARRRKSGTKVETLKSFSLKIPPS